MHQAMAYRSPEELKGRGWCLSQCMYKGPPKTTRVSRRVPVCAEEPPNILSPVVMIARKTVPSVGSGKAVSPRACLCWLTRGPRGNERPPSSPKAPCTAKPGTGSQVRQVRGTRPRSRKTGSRHRLRSHRMEGPRRAARERQWINRVITDGSTIPTEFPADGPPEKNKWKQHLGRRRSLFQHHSGKQLRPQHESPARSASASHASTRSAESLGACGSHL